MIKVLIREQCNKIVAMGYQPYDLWQMTTELNQLIVAKENGDVFLP